MNRTKNLTVAVMLAVAAAACTQQDPTSVDNALLPEQPVTTELTFPWSDFASNVAVYGGYGVPPELGTGVVAKAFDGELDARTLVRFATYPLSAVVQDSLGTTLTDYDLTFHGGRVVAFFDTVASEVPGPVTLDLGVLHTNWDVRTASWSMAVDTVGGQEAWPEPGAGPAESFTTAVWDPSAGDSAVFVLDSAQALAWQAQDSVTDSTTVVQGARLSLLTPGARLKLTSVALRLDTRSSLNPDTALVLTVGRTDLTFVYTPAPAPPTDGMRVGGVPAWRTVFDVNVPTTLSSPPTLCAAVKCPVKLNSSQVTYAALVLHTKKEDPAFQPSDSVALDVRPVFDPTALPKAPLGSSLIATGLGRRLSASLFDTGDGTAVEVPITEWVQAVIADTTKTGPRTLALLSAFEPNDISYASFYGPDSPFAPSLRMVITAGPAVEHP
ncbi:MAG: hypothetical protein LJF04_01280 [Gemmatimonadetes bacterium]|nr:hypothetical protein [Gemmatimonadota bacterium]